MLTHLLTIPQAWHSVLTAGRVKITKCTLHSLHLLPSNTLLDDTPSHTRAPCSVGTTLTPRTAKGSICLLCWYVRMTAVYLLYVCASDVM
jgi:hypothetical protein